MVSKRLVELENREAGSRVGKIGVSRHCVSFYDRIASVIGVVDIEIAIGGIVGVKSQSEKALLPARGDLRTDIDEGRLEELPIPNDSDPTIQLLHHENAVRVPRRRCREYRSPEIGGNQARFEPRRACWM